MILVLDDEEILVDLMRRFLELSGIASVGFSKPEDAVQWFQQNSQSVDMIIVDLNLGPIDGLQVLEQFRAVNPNVRALVLSGAAIDDRLQDLSKIGVEGFFSKPLKYPELVQWIKNKLQ